MPQSAFPMRGTDRNREQDSRVVSLDDAGAMIEALTSRTARGIVSALEDEPLSPAALADRVDTSIQNALYHLERLSDADLVEVVGTDYSERGHEMNVYAPAGDPVLICIGEEPGEQTLSRAVDEAPSTASLAGSD